MTGPSFPAGEGRPVYPADAVDAADADTAARSDSVGVGSVDSVAHAYTWRQALADGVLVDVTRQASPAEMHGGFTVPVAVTAAVRAAIEALPPSLHGIADPRGRLHDVLWLAAVAARGAFRASRAYCAGVPVQFVVHLPTCGTRERTRWLVVAIGPDDDGSPCVTIGFPEDF